MPARACPSDPSASAVHDDDDDDHDGPRQSATSHRLVMPERDSSPTACVSKFPCARPCKRAKRFQKFSGMCTHVHECGQFSPMSNTWITNSQRLFHESAMTSSRMLHACFRFGDAHGCARMRRASAQNESPRHACCKLVLSHMFARLIHECCIRD